MRGSIQKTWRVRIFIERDPVTGKQRFHDKTIHGTKAQADAYANRIIHLLEFGGEIPLDRNLAFSEVLKTWWAGKQHQLSPRTLDQYRTEIRLYVTPHFGTVKLKEITPTFLQRTYDRLLSEGMSATILRRVALHVRAALKRAVADGKLARNPAADIELPTIRRQPKIVFTPEQAASFVAALAAHPDGALFLLALETGLRPSEYLALRWSDLDWKTGMLTVQRTVYRRPGEGWLFSDEMKTVASRRRLPLSPPVFEALRQLAESALRKTDLIFPDTYGNPRDLGSVRSQCFKPLLRAAGLNEKMRLYDLRHTCATLLLDAAVNVRVLAERLGHSSAATTLAVYAHVLPGRQHAATETLARILGKEQEQGLKG